MKNYFRLQGHVPKTRIRLEELLNLYRSLTIQSSFYNNVFAECFLSVYLFLAICFFAFSAFCSIRLYHVLEPSIYILFPLATLLTVFQMVLIISIISKKFEKSVNILTVAFSKVVAFEFNSSPSQTRGMKKNVNAQIASLTVLKTWIGDLYYMKRSTKLIYVGFSINVVLSMLVTS